MILFKQRNNKNKVTRWPAHNGSRLVYNHAGSRGFFYTFRTERERKEPQGELREGQVLFYQRWKQSKKQNNSQTTIYVIGNRFCENFNITQTTLGIFLFLFCFSVSGFCWAGWRVTSLVFLVGSDLIWFFFPLFQLFRNLLVSLFLDRTRNRGRRPAVVNDNEDCNIKRWASSVDDDLFIFDFLNLVAIIDEGGKHDNSSRKLQNY